MFRPMRRKQQALSQGECARILRGASSGVLALAGDDGYPYAVPISYVYDQGRLFFHCAPTGHKLDAIARCDKASFCVIERDEVQPDTFTTHYRSVIAFGMVQAIKDSTLKRGAIERLSDKYSPDRAEKRDAEIEQSFNRLVVLSMTIEHMTGKEAIELTRARQG